MATRKTVKKSSKKAAPKAAKATAPPARKIRPGFISHTEIASSDPAATKAWAVKAFGWKFGDSMPMPDGSQYHMWSFAENMGGGIRPNNPPEMPGTVPYVEVASMKAAWDKAIKAGATEMLAPQQVPGGMGWIAVVQAPGGPAIGLWATK